MTRCVAFVFARGGSKGIPRKNLQVVGGLTLIARSVRTALETASISEVVVSTDDPEIAEEARTHGATVPELRPPELAADDAHELDAWRHAIGWFQDGDGTPTLDVFVSLPPTAPFCTPGIVERCIETLDESCDMVVTTTRANRHPSFNMVRSDEAGYAHLVSPPKGVITRRQDAVEVFDLTTAAYVCRPTHVLASRAVLDGRVRMVEIDRLSAIDIDDPFDLRIAQMLATEEDHD